MLALVVFVMTMFYLFYPHPDALWVPVILLSLGLSIAILNGFDALYRRKATVALLDTMTYSRRLALLSRRAAHDGLSGRAQDHSR